MNLLVEVKDGRANIAEAILKPIILLYFLTILTINKFTSLEKSFFLCQIHFKLDFRIKSF